MFGYEIRIDFSDGTFDIFTVDAHSITEAFELLGTVEEMTSSTLLCTIDRQPAVFLAW